VFSEEVSLGVPSKKKKKKKKKKKRKNDGLLSVYY